MKKRISLDCDGVIADVRGFFSNYFSNHFGERPSEELMGAIIGNRLQKYSQEIGLDYGELSNFMKDYNQKLFTSLSDLEPIKGAREGIEKLLQEGMDVRVNSYRPSVYGGINQDIKQITQEWFRENGIYIPFALAESKKAKIDSINYGRYSFHVDDDSAILDDITFKIEPILFNQELKQKNRKYSSFDSWKELTKYLTGEQYGSEK
ncbi:MAG: hypothetical protein PF542_05905 [Nanoarchaeota archaeon]|jgi:5'(3')-deoxyribonucleotidase|nr:hypothetical protein [Nanoarchaeota archaeon]